MPYADGNFTTPQPAGTPLLRFPFANNPVPDRYARTIERPLAVLPASYDPATANRTSATNQLLQSGAIATSPWTAIEATAANNIVANPWDGTVTAGRLLETTAHTVHLVRQAFTFSAGPYSYTVILKGLGRESAMIQLYDGASFYAVFLNMTTGATSTSGGPAASATALGDGWWALTLSGNFGSGTGHVDVYTIESSSTTNYVGDTSKGLYIAHAQLVTGLLAGPLIPTTSASRTVSAPDIDADDPFAYLVEESELSVVEPGLGRFTRLFARIPANQVLPTTTLFARPNLHGLKSGTSYAVSFDDGVSSHLFASRKTASVGSDPDVPSTTDRSTATNLPSATITLVRSTGADFTFSTTDSVATIRSAINSNLSSSNDNKVTVSAGEIVVVIGAGFGNLLGASASSPAVSITLSEAGTVGTLRITATNQLATTVREIASTAHGGAAGDHYALWNGDSIVAQGIVVSAATDTFEIPMADLPDADAVVTHCAFASGATHHIANGPMRCSARLTSQFYLPGVTAGINTAADIDPPAVVTDPQSYFAEVLTYLGSPGPTIFAVHEVNDLRQWRGPILMQDVLSLQLADAVRTV
jgi:hypothetical protein